MTFGKDQDPRADGLKGLRNITEKRRKANSDRNRKAWQDPEYRKKQLDNLAKARSKINLSAAGKKSRVYENETAAKMKESYEHLFQPFQVCDRIGVKDGKLCFIEIKRAGRRLSKEQTMFQGIIESSSLQPQYLVVV